MGWTAEQFAEHYVGRLVSATDAGRSAEAKRIANDLSRVTYERDGTLLSAADRGRILQEMEAILPSSTRELPGGGFQHLGGDNRKYLEFVNYIRSLTMAGK
jgi:hypothetical protein